MMVGAGVQSKTIYIDSPWWQNIDVDRYCEPKAVQMAVENM
jgi:hypothetical protein